MQFKTILKVENGNTNVKKNSPAADLLARFACFFSRYKFFTLIRGLKVKKYTGNLFKKNLQLKDVC